MTSNQALELFGRLRDLPDLTWTHDNTGCESRADLMAESAAAEGLDPKKIWITSAPGAGSPFGIYLNEAQTEMTYCRYHVAVLLQIDGKPLVFDPAFFEEPVARERWVKRLSGRCLEYETPVSVTERDWRYFYGPDDNFLNREGAVATRDRLLALSKDLDNHTVFFGVMAKLRGRWVDELREADPDACERIRSKPSDSPFRLWLQSVERSAELKKWLEENERYYGLRSSEILEAIDFTDRFANFEVRKRYWPYVYALVEALKQCRFELLERFKGTYDQDLSLLYRSIFPDNSEDRRAWYARGNHREWERFGVDFRGLAAMHLPG